MDEPQASQSRTTPLFLLRLLCILSFAGSGLGAFAYGFVGIFFNVFKEQDFSRFGAEELQFITMLLSAGKGFFLLNSVLFALSLSGAILMWNLRRIGFHLYTSAQILLLILPLAYFKGFTMPSLSIWLTVAFIIGYASYIKLFK